MTLRDYLMFMMLLAFGNMLRKQGDDQRKYAQRIVSVTARLCKSIPLGTPIWMVLHNGAVACANGDMITTIHHGMIVMCMKNELLQEINRRKRLVVAEGN